MYRRVTAPQNDQYRGTQLPRNSVIGVCRGKRSSAPVCIRTIVTCVYFIGCACMHISIVVNACAHLFGYVVCDGVSMHVCTCVSEYVFSFIWVCTMCGREYDVARVYICMYVCVYTYRMGMCLCKYAYVRMYAYIPNGLPHTPYSWYKPYYFRTPCTFVTAQAHTRQYTSLLRPTSNGCPKSVCVNKILQSIG